NGLRDSNQGVGRQFFKQCRLCPLETIVGGDRSFDGSMSEKLQGVFPEIKGETVRSCRNAGAFGLEDGEILCQELHFAGRQGAGGDSPDMAEFMIGPECTIPYMAVTLR